MKAPTTALGKMCILLACLQLQNISRNLESHMLTSQALFRSILVSLMILQDLQLTTVMVSHHTSLSTLITLSRPRTLLVLLTNSMTSRRPSTNHMSESLWDKVTQDNTSGQSRHKTARTISVCHLKDLRTQRISFTLWVEHQTNPR